MSAPLLLAQASAAGTTVGAPTPLSMGAQPGATAQAPQAGPPQGPPQAPPAGAPANPVVQAHAQRSVGTHPSQSPQKRGNPTFGMSK